MVDIELALSLVAITVFHCGEGLLFFIMTAVTSLWMQLLSFIAEKCLVCSFIVTCSYVFCFLIESWMCSVRELLELLRGCFHCHIMEKGYFCCSCFRDIFLGRILFVAAGISHLQT